VALVASFATGAACAQGAPGGLEQELARIAASTGAVIGVHARHLESGEEHSHNAGLGFPMASTYKVAIGACVLREAGRGRFTLTTLLPVEPRQRSTSSVLSDRFPHSGLSVSLHNLLELMLTQSDNTATDVLLEAIGGPAAVQRCLDEAGLTGMRVDRSTAQILRQFGGLEDPVDPSLSFFEQFETMLARSEAGAYFQDGGSPHNLAFERDPRDHATPAAMTRLLVMIWREDWPSPQAARVLRDILGRSQEPIRLGRGLPAGTPLAHKTGTLAGTVNDTGVFELPGGRGHVAITVFVKGARGPWEPVEVAIGDLARAVYDDFVLSPGSMH